MKASLLKRRPGNNKEKRKQGDLEVLSPVLRVGQAVDVALDELHSASVAVRMAGLVSLLPRRFVGVRAGLEAQPPGFGEDLFRYGRPILHS